jgi:hypothetical protein
VFPTPCAARTVEMHHIICLHTYYFTANMHPGTLSHFRNNPQSPQPFSELKISKLQNKVEKLTNSKGSATVLT